MELDIRKLLVDESWVFLPAEASASSSVLKTKYVEVTDNTPTDEWSLPEGRPYLHVAYSGVTPLPAPPSTSKASTPLPPHPPATDDSALKGKALPAKGKKGPFTWISSSTEAELATMYEDEEDMELDRDRAMGEAGGCPQGHTPASEMD